MSMDILLDQKNKAVIIEKMRDEINNAAGRKALEFGCGPNTLAEDLRDRLDYLACTDKSADLLENYRKTAEMNEITLIPYEEIGEDCYFGRFNLVYTNFSFFNISHLVDEIMRLRRLIIKGGKLIIIDRTEDLFEAECVKQLKRCGFSEIRQEPLTLDGTAAFFISAQK